MFWIKDKQSLACGGPVGQPRLMGCPKGNTRSAYEMQGNTDQAALAVCAGRSWGALGTPGRRLLAGPARSSYSVSWIRTSTYTRCEHRVVSDKKRIRVTHGF